MKKLIAKIVGIATVFAMVIGIGVAVANNKEMFGLKASSAWSAHSGSITAGNEYLIVRVDGSYSMNPKNSTASGSTTVSAGSYSQTSFNPASGPDRGFVFADAGGGKFYIKDGTCFVRANGTTNNGLASAASNNNNSAYGIWTVTETATSGIYTIVNNNNRQISAYESSNWRSYATTSDSRTNVKLYEKTGGGGGSSSSSSAPSSSSSSQAPSTFTVTYNANGATSGTVPVDNNIYHSYDPVHVLGNTGSLAKTGCIWGGWSKYANGTGTSFAPGSGFNISENTTLYARWLTDYSETENLIITAEYLNLDNTGITAYTKLTADDKIQYAAEPSDSKNVVKATPINGSSTNKFNSESPVLMGKQGAYLYNIDPLGRNIARIEVFINYGAAAAAEVAIKFGTAMCTSSYTQDAQTLNPANAVYTFTSSVANAQFFRVQVTQNANVQIQLKVVFEVPTESVTVTPESVTLNPLGEQQLTTVVEPANTTYTLTYTSSNPSVASVSNSGLITANAVGSATITATSGSCSDTCEVTVERPFAPYITPTKVSTSGYTGQQEVIPFTYGNLDYYLGLNRQNTNIRVDIQNDDGEGNAELLIRFDTAGSSEAYLKDGSNILATISVTVLQSMVTITGMPETKAMSTGKTFDFGALISVTAVGACTSSVFWDSSVHSVATVSNAGVVTAVGPGTTVITARPSTYAEGAVSCTLTVANLVSAEFGNEDADGSAVTTDEDLKAVTGYTIDEDIEFSNLTNCYASANKTMKFGTSSKKASFTVGLKDGEINGVASNITKITVNAKTYNTDSTTILIAGEEKVLTNEYADYDVEFEGYNTITVDIEASGASYQRFRIAYINIYYENTPSTQEKVERLQTTSSLSYKYHTDDSINFTFSDVAIRFGCLISKELWDELDGNSHDILGYGVIIAATDDVAGTFQNFYTEITESHEHPTEAEDWQKNGKTGDYYIWNLYKKIMTSEEGLTQEQINNKLTRTYYAHAYIRTSSHNDVILTMATASAQSLAFDLIDSGEYDDDAFDCSLLYLAVL